MLGFCVQTLETPAEVVLRQYGISCSAQRLSRHADELQRQQYQQQILAQKTRPETLNVLLERAGFRHLPRQQQWLTTCAAYGNRSDVRPTPKVSDLPGLLLPSYSVPGFIVGWFFLAEGRDPEYLPATKVKHRGIWGQLPEATASWTVVADPRLVLSAQLQWLVYNELPLPFAATAPGILTPLDYGNWTRQPLQLWADALKLATWQELIASEGLLCTDPYPDWSAGLVAYQGKRQFRGWRELLHKRCKTATDNELRTWFEVLQIADTDFLTRYPELRERYNPFHEFGPPAVGVLSHSVRETATGWESRGQQILNARWGIDSIYYLPDRTRYRFWIYFGDQLYHGLTENPNFRKRSLTWLTGWAERERLPRLVYKPFLDAHAFALATHFHPPKELHMPALGRSPEGVIHLPRADLHLGGAVIPVTNSAWSERDPGGLLVFPPEPLTREMRTLLTGRRLWQQSTWVLLAQAAASWLHSLPTQMVNTNTCIAAAQLPEFESLMLGDSLVVHRSLRRTCLDVLARTRLHICQLDLRDLPTPIDRILRTVLSNYLVWRCTHAAPHEIQTTGAARVELWYLASWWQQQGGCIRDPLRGSRLVRWSTHKSILRHTFCELLKDLVRSRELVPAGKTGSYIRFRIADVRQALGSEDIPAVRKTMFQVAQAMDAISIDGKSWKVPLEPWYRR